LNPNFRRVMVYKNYWNAHRITMQQWSAVIFEPPYNKKYLHPVFMAHWGVPHTTVVFCL
jgi:hypothetical protein